MSAAKLADESGLSRPYCAAILRGERVPHARWWQVLTNRSEERLSEGIPGGRGSRTPDGLLDRGGDEFG